MTTLQNISAATNWNIRVSENFTSVSPAALYGINPITTTGLTLGYLGGEFNGVTVADGTVSLTASNTNYVVAHRTTGVVTAATNTTNWLNTTTYLQLYQFVAGTVSFTIAATSDKRQAFGGAGGGGTGMSNPMTTAGDIIYGGTPSGGIAPPTRLGVGANGQVLTLAAGVPTWAAASGGFSNPMTTNGDLILGGASGAAGRLAIGSTNQVLTVVGGTAAWAAAASGFANPMTTVGDLIVGGASGAATRVAAGTASFVLTSNGAGVAPTWQAGLTNPMTTTGDIIYSSSGSTPARLGVGSNGNVLTLAAGVPTWAAPGGGSLSNWTESVNSSSPNATIPVVRFLATNAATNVDAALSSKGTGSILAQVPDSAPSGGNKRGTNSVDLQMTRSSATSVASGASSTVSGGTNNAASGSNSTVPGGSSNTASGGNSFAAGSGANASNTASFAFGISPSSQGQASLALGESVTADAAYSRATGAYSKTRSVIGAEVHGCATTSQGRHQRGFYMGGITTTGATPTAITADGGAAGTNNQIPVSNNYGACTIRGLVVARSQNTGGNSKHWEFTAAAYRDTTAGSVAIIGTPTVTVIAASAGASAWLFDLVADTTNGMITPRATGVAATQIRWSVNSWTIEVEHP